MCFLYRVTVHMCIYFLVSRSVLFKEEGAISDLEEFAFYHHSVFCRINQNQIFFLE